MSSMTSMNISLPAELKEYVEGRSHGGYSTPSEYIRELIRADQKRHAKERLDALLLEGLGSGDATPANAEFWAGLTREARVKLQARKRPAK